MRALLQDSCVQPYDLLGDSEELTTKRLNSFFLFITVKEHMMSADL